MRWQSTFSVQRAASLGRSLALALVTITLGWESTAPAALQYAFLPITASSGTGNTTFSQFTSGNNGFITVSHLFPNGGVGGADNNNAAIFPSQFNNVFPGTNQVQGHLAQTVYGFQSVVTFNMVNYSISPTTIFGMWNTTDEVSAPPGGNPVYRVQLRDSGGNIVNPTTLTVYGKGDNQTQVAGRHELDMNPATGEITPGVSINGGVGTHTSATFWNNIPTGTREIIVYADLPPLNPIGDGVGYYFAEVVPEPSSLGLLAIGGVIALRRTKGGEW